MVVSGITVAEFWNTVKKKKNTKQKKQTKQQIGTIEFFVQ